MPNPYINRVDIRRGNTTETLINIGDTTAVASDVASGKYFYLATGEKVVGTSSGGGTGGVTQDQDGYLVLDDEGGGGGGGGDSWSWMGKNPTKVHTLTERVSFSDLGVGSWTYSTTATTLRANQNYPSIVSCDMSQYDYLQLVRVNVTHDYGDWPLLGAAENYAFVGGYVLFRDPIASRSDLSGGTSLIGGTIASRRYLLYTGTTGSATSVVGSYGVYTDSVSSYGSSSGTYPNRDVTWRKPSISIRGHASYFTQDAFEHLDMGKSYYDLICEVWRVDAGTLDNAWMYHEVPNILTNGLEVTS